MKVSLPGEKPYYSGESWSVGPYNVDHYRVRMELDAAWEKEPLVMLVRFINTIWRKLLVRTRSRRHG